MADVSQIKLPNGDTFDLVDEKSGYITAQYIENKTDYAIPVSRVGEIVVGETAIGTDSTNFPTSKAVVDYVDERVVQEIDAIDVGVTSVNGKTGSVTLSASDVGAATISQIPTYTSQLTNDSGFITASRIVDEKVKQEVVSSSINKHLSILLAPAVNGTYTTTTYKDRSFTYQPSTGLFSVRQLRLQNSSQSGSTINTVFIGASTTDATITFPDATGTVALTSDIPTVPTNISSFTNDSGYLTASDIASVMTYKGTKANYAALPASGNTTGDVWHLTDTGAEWAWDGSAWQELGTAIDLSGYATKATTLAGYGITDANIQNGTITLGGNSITPLTSFTETDPTVPSWAKASTKPTYTAAEVGALPDTTTIPSKTSDLTNDSGFITGYTETDPVFSASAAAGITSTDISNWNAKVSDTGEWNGVSLSKNSTITQTSPIYVPYLIQTSSSSAALLSVISDTTGVSAANKIPKYNTSGYLVSTTPSANDNSKKVATTAYVDAAIPKVYSSTNTGGYLTMATLPIYDGTVV